MSQAIVHHSLVQLRPKRRFRSEVSATLDDLDAELPPPSAEESFPSSPTFAPSAAASPSPQPGVTRKRILVVDNEPASTRMVRLTLGRSGLFEVCEVNDSTRALVTARRFQPHLALLDIEMPGLDGSAVAQQLRGDDAFRHLPIVFMTSLVTPEEADQHLHTGGSRILSKPVTTSKLMQSISEMLHHLLATGLPTATAS